METPPFAKINEIRCERDQVAARDRKLAIAEGEQLQALSQDFSDAEIAEILGLTAQRVGQLRRRSRALADIRSPTQRLFDGALGAAANRNRRRSVDR